MFYSKKYNMVINEYMIFYFDRKKKGSKTE